VLSYAVTNVSNGALFAALPAVSVSGTLTYEPAAGASGTSTFDVSVQDDGGTAGGGVDTSPAQTFTITVTANTLPTISAIADQGILEDGSTGALAFTVGDAETAAASLVVTATSSNQALVPDGNLVLGGAGADRTIEAVPVGDSSGVATVTVVVDDGTDTAEEQFVLTVASVNDAPSFAASDPPSVVEDAGSQAVVGWAVFDAGPSDEEAVQSVLSYAVTNVSNGALFAALPAVSVSGTLTYEPAAGASGTSTFDVSVQDDACADLYDHGDGCQ